jgi:hypothetical protein
MSKQKLFCKLNKAEDLLWFKDNKRLSLRRKSCVDHNWKVIKVPPISSLEEKGKPFDKRRTKTSN